MSLRALARQFAGLAAALVVSAGALVTLAPTPAFAGTATFESQFVARMNAARQAAGLRPYAVAGDLTDVARRHSARMAAQQRLYHNPNLTSDVQNWQAVGENVGDGPTVDDIHNAFMHSPEHKANILDHDFTQVGVGVSVDSNGVIWVTEDFRQPMRAAPAPTRHRTTSAPKPAPTHTTTTRSTATAHPRATHSTLRAASTHPTRHGTVGPAPTPTATLLARLAAASAKAPSADPVAQAFAFVDTVSSLTSAG